MPSRVALFALGFLLVLVLAAQLAQLRESQGGPDRPADPDLAALRTEVRSLSQAMAQSQRRLERIEEHAVRTAELVGELEDRSQAQEVREVQQQALEAESGGGAGGGAAPGTLGMGPGSSGGVEGDGGIPEVLQRLAEMEKKIEHRGKNGDQWKPTTEEMTRELEMTSDQQLAVVREANSAKDQLMALCRIPRADGGLFLDDFGEAYRDSLADPSGGQQKYGALLMRLMVEKVPGRDATYFTELMTISAEAHRGFQAVLSPKQYADLQGHNVDVFGIQTGYDPVGDYVAARWGGRPK